MLYANMKHILSTIAIASLLACGYAGAEVKDLSAGSIGFNPSSIAVTEGDSFSINIVTTDIHELLGGTFNLDYDSSVVQIDSVAIDAYWDFDPAAGSKVSSSSWTRIGFDTYVNDGTGDHTIATLNLTALTAGSFTFNIVNSFFANSLDEITPALVGSAITVNP